MNKIKKTLLERLFGIKPKNNILTYNKITPLERNLITEDYNEWCRRYNVSSRINRRTIL